MNDQLQVNTEIIDIDKLKPNPRNPRTITKPAMERLKHQLWKLGQYKPIIIDTRTGLIIGGHMRYEALKLLGVDKVMVSYITSENDQEALEYALSDNDEAGTTVQDQLLGLIEQYPDIKLDDYAVKFDEGETLADFMKQFSSEEIKEDELPEVAEGEPISKVGEVYQLGRHRLMCGDSTKIEDVEKLMDGKKADITFHSPPYNVGHNLGYNNDNKYENYKDDNPAYLALLSDSTNNGLEFSQYVFVNLQFLANNKRQIIDYLHIFRDYFVDIAYWKKSQVQPAMAKNVMNSQCENIFIFNRENQSRAINTGSFHGDISNFIETNSASGENENAEKHNATFPVAFASHFIKNFSKNSVIDLFGGTGTTLIVCEQTNRICYMMELDPKYCDVIRKRYAKFIGKEEEWQTITPLV